MPGYRRVPNYTDVTVTPGPHPLAVPNATVEDAARRLAVLLTTGGGAIADPGAGHLEFESSIVIRPLDRRPAPAEAWAVDGGQALVADARCLQLVVVRAARVRFRSGSCDLEDAGELKAYLVGGGQERDAVAALGFGIPPDATVDVNLLRDREEWHAATRCLDDAEPGAMVLVDGDLQPDWRIPSRFLASTFELAARKGTVLAGVVKRSSLARGGAPLLGQLEMEGEALFGPRARWWAPVARTRPDVGAGVQVVVARLDPDAPFAFRVDLPADADPVEALGALAALADDAGFPGYPYPLAVADRLAACPRWLRDDVWFELEDHFDRAGVPLEVRERAFADRHHLMERY